MIALHNIRIKNRVKCISGNDYEYRPIWGGHYGKIGGTIVKVDFDRSDPIKVYWDNGTVGWFGGYALDLLIEDNNNVSMIDKTKDCLEIAITQLKPYRYYIGFIALLIVIEIFILKGKTTSYITKSIHTFVDQIFNSVDKQIGKEGEHDG